MKLTRINYEILDEGAETGVVRRRYIGVMTDQEYENAIMAHNGIAPSEVWEDDITDLVDEYEAYLYGDKEAGFVG